MDTQASSQNDIFEYDSYRAYLRDFYQSKKAQNPQYSYRVFSRSAGFRSPNFLQLVITGKRNLSPESLEKVIKTLKLKKKQAEYFRLLVYLNQAQTSAERTLYADQLMRSRHFPKARRLKKDEYRYYANWHNVPIRELVTLSGFSEDPDWIAKRLVPPISPQQARKALALLLHLGLLRREESGKLVQAEALVSTGDEITSTAVAQYHRSMIEKGAEAIDRFPGEQRDVSSVTLSLSKEKFLEIKSLVQRFRKELLTIAAEDAAPDAVYQLNFQLFPLTKSTRRESEE